MDTEQLYQDRILAFARAARQHSCLDAPSHSATVNNPSCGDEVRVDVELDDNGRITQLGAMVKGCALCEAATGLLLETLVGHHHSALPALETALAQWLKGERDDAQLNDQDAFTPVREFTTRHGCVRLPFQAAAQAITNQD